MKKLYTRPALVEYGRMGELTLGAGGAKPDLPPLPTPNCSDTGTSTYACLTASAGTLARLGL